MEWLRKRLAFVIAAERYGYEWFAGIWRFLAPLAGLLALSGLVAAVLADVSWLTIVAAFLALALLLFAEGAYRMWREASPPPLTAALPALEALHNEGRSLKQWLHTGFVNDTLEAPEGEQHLAAWTAKVVTEVEPLRPGDAYQIEQEDAASVLTAFAGTSGAESDVLNRLTKRLARLQNVIAELKSGHR